MHLRRRAHKIAYTFLTALALCAGCSATASRESASATGAKHFSHDAQQLATIANDQIGCGPCGAGNCPVYQTSGGSSCNDSTEWCADFVMWVWSQAGFKIDGLSPCSASFIQYGNDNGTMHQTPQVGDAIIWNYPNGQACDADHVEIVVGINPDGSVQGVSGNGANGRVSPDHPCRGIGPCSSYTAGWSLSAFVGPAGGSGGSPPPSGGSGPCSGINDCTYCGNDPQGPGGDASTLYQCSGGALVGSTPCANGCQITPGDSCDVCNQGSSPPPSGGGDPCDGIPDGGYCGNDPDGPGGDPDTLYQCTNGMTAATTACPNGCQIAPGNQDDYCN